MNITQHEIHKVRTRRLDAKGAIVHMFGRTILKRANRQGKDPKLAVIKHFQRTGGVHAMIWYDGSIHQFLPWDIQGAHAGVSRADKRLYRSGDWERKVVPETLAMWMAKHPGISNPLDLTGGQSPNLSTHGIELAPLLFARPNGEWYTDDQYKALGELLAFLEQRGRGGPEDYYTHGHEDVSPLRRWYTPKQKRHVRFHGGWDLGALRPDPRFRWANIKYPNKPFQELPHEELTRRLKFALACFGRKFWR